MMAVGGVTRGRSPCVKTANTLSVKSIRKNINCCVRGGHKPARWPWPTSQASCDRLTENVCAVCDVMEMCVSDCIRISEKHGTHVFG